MWRRVGAGVSRLHRKRTAGPLAHRTRRTARRRQATRTARDAGCAAKARRMATGGIPTEPGGAHARAQTAPTGGTRRGGDDEPDKRPPVRRATRAEYRRRSGTHRKGDAPRRSDRTRTQSRDCGAVRAQSIGAIPCGAYRCGGIPRRLGGAQVTAATSIRRLRRSRRERPAKQTTAAGTAAFPVSVSRR